MTNQLTSQQIEWAKSHDWYVDVREGKLIVADRYTIHGTYVEGEIIWVESFKALRDWAGY